MAPSKKFFILTGDPGVGKTTLTKKICQSLRENGVNTVGFYTEEVRRNGVREGFDVVTLDGKRGQLARNAQSLTEVSEFKLGKYAVLVREFEDVGLRAVNETPENPRSLLVIDEIGKMELLSNKFRARMKEIFSPLRRGLILATIPSKGDQFVEALRRHPLSQVFVPIQLGFGSKGGCEAAVHAMRTYIKERGGEVILKVDVKNALDSVDRGAMLAEGDIEASCWEEAKQAWRLACPGEDSPNDPTVQRQWDEPLCELLQSGLLQSSTSDAERARLLALTERESGYYL